MTYLYGIPQETLPEGNQIKQAMEAIRYAETRDEMELLREAVESVTG